MSTDGQELKAIEAHLDRVLASYGEEVIPLEILQKMFTVAVTQYSRRYEEDSSVVPMVRQYVTATDVANSVLEMLRVVDLELFELTMWGSRLWKEPARSGSNGGNS